MDLTAYATSDCGNFAAIQKALDPLSGTGAIYLAAAVREVLRGMPACGYAFTDPLRGEVSFIATLRHVAERPQQMTFN